MFKLGMRAKCCLNEPFKSTFRIFFNAHKITDLYVLVARIYDS